MVSLTMMGSWSMADMEDQLSLAHGCRQGETKQHQNITEEKHRDQTPADPPNVQNVLCC